MIENNSSGNRRLYLLCGLLMLVLLSYVGVMYDTQIRNGSYYRERSVRTITTTENVEASRGVLTDRNGQVLVSSRQTYALTFDASLLSEEDDENEAILRLIRLCRQQEVAWSDNLPISRAAPYAYTVDSAGSVQRNRFVKFLQTSVKTLSTNVSRENVTEELLSSILPPDAMMKKLREFFAIPAAWTDTDARAVIGVRYELEVRRIVNTTAYVFAEDVDTALISLIKDGDYRGIKVSSSSVREYSTSAAAHVLGTVGRINEQELAAADPALYNGEDWIGKSGVELAFEDYLRGKDGTRLISSNADGKITDEIYLTEPEPGSTVALTLDIDLQQATEQALASTISELNKDGNTTRGAGAAVIQVGTGEVLALASYPTFDPATYGQDAAVLNSDPGQPLFNRATQGRYAPGSTFKPCTAIAALESGVTTTTEKIRDTGRWYYPDMVAGTEPFSAWCWNRSGHGQQNVTQAITNSCNYFFYTMGYRLGIDRLDEYAAAFGLGSRTGIEIGDDPGVLAGPTYSESVGQTWYGGNTVMAAIGQSDNLFTPLQLANYIATLVGGGEHYAAHLLKSVKTYDNSAVICTGDAAPLNTVSIQPENLAAVKNGMHDLTTRGSLSSYFSRCVVDAAAKTGTAQISKNTKNNGVFVCFAPFDEPEIAVSIVIEKGGSGAALANAAVDILNAYFTKDEIGYTVVGEGSLIP